MTTGSKIKISYLNLKKRTNEEIQKKQQSDFVKLYCTENFLN